MATRHASLGSETAAGRNRRVALGNGVSRVVKDFYIPLVPERLLQAAAAPQVGAVRTRHDLFRAHP